jgi:hypothetical protein
MSDTQERLGILVAEIDDADGYQERDFLLDKFVELVNSSDDRTLDAWLDDERDELDTLSQYQLAQPSPLAPPAALLRAQAVTKALGLAANIVKKGVSKVRNLLNKWIGRLQTWLVNTIKKTTGATEVSLDVALGPVTIGVSW